MFNELEAIAATLQVGIFLIGVLVLFIVFDMADRRIKEWKERRLLEELMKRAKAQGQSVFRYGEKIVMVNLNIENAVRKSLRFFGSRSLTRIKDLPDIKNHVDLINQIE